MSSTLQGPNKGRLSSSKGPRMKLGYDTLLLGKHLPSNLQNHQLFNNSNQLCSKWCMHLTQLSNAMWYHSKEDSLSMPSWHIHLGKHGNNCLTSLYYFHAIMLYETWALPIHWPRIVKKFKQSPSLSKYIQTRSLYHPSTYIACIHLNDNLT